MGFKITKKQQKILDFVSDFIEKNGFSPTYREIATGLDLKAVSSVAEHIENLVAKGILRKSGDHGRVVEIIDLSYPETTSLFRSRLMYATDREKTILLEAAKILGIDDFNNFGGNKND